MYLASALVTCGAVLGPAGCLVAALASLFPLDTSSSSQPPFCCDNQSVSDRARHGLGEHTLSSRRVYLVEMCHR